MLYLYKEYSFKEYSLVSRESFGQVIVPVLYLYKEYSFKEYSLVSRESFGQVMYLLMLATMYGLSCICSSQVNYFCSTLQHLRDIVLRNTVQFPGEALRK